MFVHTGLQQKEGGSEGNSAKGTSDDANVVKTITVSFEGDYNKIIGANKKTFLEQCSTFISEFTAKVICADVRPGSILVDLKGSQTNLQSAVSGVASKGLKLEGFPPLQVTGSLDSKILSYPFTHIHTHSLACLSHAPANC